MKRTEQERQYWDKATKSKNLRNEWICDKNITDKQCLGAILPDLREGKTLDLGCGVGRLTLNYGVDISEEMLKLAYFAKPQNEYKLCNGRSIPYPDEFFDNVFSFAMFQHIPDGAKQQYIKEVHRVLKPGGVFRLQFVVEGESGPFSYPVSLKIMYDYCDELGFDVNHIDHGLLAKEWIWLTAIK